MGTHLFPWWPRLMPVLSATSCSAGCGLGPPTGLASAVALAPVAVLPEHQRKGIGGRLIRYGLELLRCRGEKIVIVVGHPDYYPRFGFSREKAHSLESPFPAEAFMAVLLGGCALWLLPWVVG